MFYLLRYKPFIIRVSYDGSSVKEQIKLFTPVFGGEKKKKKTFYFHDRFLGRENKKTFYFLYPPNARENETFLFALSHLVRRIIWTKERL